MMHTFFSILSGTVMGAGFATLALDENKNVRWVASLLVVIAIITYVNVRIDES